MRMQYNKNTHSRTIKSYTFRSGRMTTGQKNGLNDAWSQYGLSIKQGIIDFTTIFNNNAPTILEIGYGMGYSLTTMAKSQEDINFIGVEIYKPGVGSLLNKALKLDLKNIRTYCADANEVIDECIPDCSLFKILIYFPDPWPKTRHQKRRLIQPYFIDKVQRKLKKNSIIHLATDWEDYAHQMLNVLNKHPNLHNKSVDKTQFSVERRTRPTTKFEERGTRLGHNIWDLEFIKK